MYYTKIIKRENGDTIKIGVTLILPFLEKKAEYGLRLMITPKGKRKDIDPIDTDSWEYRQASFPEGRRQHEYNQMLRYASAEELLQAKLELWEKIKPI